MWYNYNDYYEGGNKMKCPICGAKMIGKQLCQYCKITDDQIINASNRKVKEYRKSYKSDQVYYTNVIPKDISRLKLILYTIFLGFLGIHHFYVLRPVRGWFSMVTSVGSFLMILLSLTGVTKISIISIIFDILFLGFTINIIMWVLDIFSVLFKSYKVPIVLADKKR